MQNLYLIQSTAGKSVSELEQERFALLEKAKFVLGEGDFEIRRVSPAIGMGILNGSMLYSVGIRHCFGWINQGKETVT